MLPPVYKRVRVMIHLQNSARVLEYARAKTVTAAEAERGMWGQVQGWGTGLSVLVRKAAIQELVPATVV